MDKFFQLNNVLGAVVSLGASLGVIYGWVVRPIRNIVRKLDALTEDVAYLQGERLNSAYDFYIQRGWCSGAKKRELERWYTAYKSAGHNHLADNYINSILALPEQPQT